MAALPLPAGNIVAIGATGTVSFVADLNPAVYTLRCNISGGYRYEARRKTVDGAANLFLAPGAHVRGSAENASVVFVDIGTASVARALAAEPPQDFALHALPAQRGAMLRATAFAAAHVLGCRAFLEVGEASRSIDEVRKEIDRAFLDND